MMARKMGAGKASPVAAGRLPPAPAPFCTAIDAGALGVVWSLLAVGVDVLAVIRTDSLQALDAVKAFDGLFAWLAPNRSRPRAWMPALSPVALDAVRSQS